MVVILDKAGGLSALIAAVLYVTGFALFMTVLDFTGDGGLAQRITFIAENQFAFYLAYLLIYVVFGVVLVVIAMALHELLESKSPTIMKLATVFGLIWAGLVIASGMIANIGNATVIDLLHEHPEQAESLWLAIRLIGVCKPSTVVRSDGQVSHQW